MRRWKVLVIAGVTTLVVLGLGLLAGAIGRSLGREPAAPGRDHLAQSNEPCVECHRRATPGIVAQYARSAKAAAGVRCGDCHVVEQGYPGSVAHEGTFVLRSPTPARCRRCHQAETAQFLRSRHALPAYVAYAGTEALSPAHRKEYESIPEGQQFLMPATFHEYTLIKDQNQIGVTHRTEPVRNHDARTVEAAQVFVDDPLCHYIEIARRFVKQQDGGMMGKSTRNRQPLPLSACQIDSTLCDHCVVTHGQTDDFIVDCRQLGCFHYLIKRKTFVM